MNALNKNGREEMRMWKAFLIILTFLLFMSYPVRADLVFDSGYNTYDESYGYNAEVWAINDAILDVFGGQIGKLEYDNNASGNIYSGVIGSFNGVDSSIVYIYDGTIDRLWTGNNSVVSIHGGQLGIFTAYPDSIVKLYARDTIYHTSGGFNNSPWIEGVYLDSGTPFSFSFDGDDDYSRFQIIPEPATILLLCSGVLLLKKRL
jgi:hypothetical protein